MKCFFCYFCYFWIFIFQDFPPAWNPGERNIAANVAGINFIHIQRRFMHFALKAFWFTQKVNLFTHTQHTRWGEKVNVFSFLSLITINIDSVRIIDKLEKDLFWRRVIDGHYWERSEIVTLHHVTQKQFAFQSRWCNRAKYDKDEWSKKNILSFFLFIFKQFVFVVEDDRSRHCWAPISFYVPPHNNLIVQLPPIKRNQNPNLKSKL